MKSIDFEKPQARAPKQDSRAGTKEPTPTEAWIQVTQVKGKSKVFKNVQMKYNTDTSIEIYQDVLRCIKRYQYIRIYEDN